MLVKLDLECARFTILETCFEYVKSLSIYTQDLSFKFNMADIVTINISNYEIYC